jgi:hypothetical protein
MQKDSLYKFSVFPLLAGGLLLSLTVGNAWADTPTSNIEGWDVEESEYNSEDNWTWFGMGYESRVSGNQGSAASGSPSSGAGAAAGAGGPAAVMNQRGPGRR